MLSLREMRRVAGALGELVAGHRVQAVVQPGPAAVVITSFGGDRAAGGERRRHLLFCARPGSARVSQLARPPAALPVPPAFSQYLRAHLTGARIEGARLRGEDRTLALSLAAEEGRFELVLAILGPRTNVFLLDAGSRIAAVLRPLAQTRPELAIGEVWTPPESRPPSEGDDRFAGVADDDLLAAIEAHYAERERRDEHDSLRRRIETALRKEARTRTRKLEKLEGELAEAREAAALERRGELLKGVLSGVGRGDREVVARDHASGEDVVIPLDPAKSPSENLAALFKRYQKAVRKLAKAGAQEDAVRAGADAMAALTREFESLADDDAALTAFAERPEIRKLLDRYAPAEPARTRSRSARAEKKLGRHTIPARLAPRRYRSTAGLEIWVGRSDAGNDYLTTRLARGKDLFFHLDGAPGSHVVLRTEGRADPPSEAVLEACELAVHFSKLRNASRADVHVVPIQNVKKPRGAKPGLVLVHGGKTVHLRRIPQRLQRVLDARIED